MHGERIVNRVELQFPLKASLAFLTSPGIFSLDFFSSDFCLSSFFSFSNSPPPHHPPPRSWQKGKGRRAVLLSI